MKKLIVLASFTLIAFLSCGTLGSTAQSASVADNQSNVFTVNITNKTFFDIEIHSEDRLIPRNGAKEIKLPVQSNELTEGYKLTYRVPLSAEVTKKIPSDNNIIIKSNQKVITIDYPEFNISESYFTIINNSDRAIKVVRTNSRDVSRANLGPDAILRGSRIELPKGIENVYAIDATSSSVEAGDKLYTIPVDKSRAGFLYSFAFDGKTVSLTDARPLTCVGEPAWSRKLAGTNMPVFAEYADRSVKVAIPSNNGADFIALDAKGKETGKKSVGQYGANAVLSAIRNIDEDNYLVTGYGTRPARQFLVKQTADDEITWSMPFPQRTGYLLNTVIPKAGKTFLAAGTVDGAAYMREIEDRGRSGVSVWELWAGDANKNWKTIQSAAYNARNNTYIITGMYGGIDPVSGKQNAFIGFVNQSGKPDTAKNDIILNDSIVNQVLCDSSGNFYIAGQELRDGLGYAIVQKYSSDGKKLWQQAEEIKANSLYRCAVLDEENGQIVLGGAMNAADKYGNRGAPFLQGIDSANGNELWIGDISPVSKELNLVTGLQKAKGYGFIAALYGTNGKDNVFTIARLNARGKLINHESH